MSYTELEHGYQGLRSASRPVFYVGDLTGQPNLVGPVPPAIFHPSSIGELSDGCITEDGCLGAGDLEGQGKQVLVGICAMAKKSQSKPMKEILTRLEEFEYIKIVVFAEEVILKEPVEDWPIVDCLISFHSKGFPLDKAISYANLRNPFIINNLPMQYDIQDRRRVYSILEGEGIEIPRYAVLDRDSSDPSINHELVESEDHVEVNGVTFNKPFVEKPVSAEDHNIYIYYPTSAGGGSQRLFRKIGSRSSVYSPESRVRKTGSYIYEDFMPTDGTDVKVYTVGPDYAHAEARKSPALDGKVERDSEGKEIRYPVILSNAEKLISRKVCLAFKQTVCGFDLLRANGKSFVCDVNGFSFVKNSNKYYDDCAKILGNMILRELAPTLHIPWSVPFQLDDPPIVPTTFGKMMELRCVVAVIRHGDRTPKQKMKVEVRHPKFFEIFAKYDGYKHGHVKLKRPKQLQEILDTARSLLAEIQHRAAGPELEEKQGKLEQLKSVLEMYGHFSGINRKVQMKYQPRGRPRGSSSDDGKSSNRLGEPSLVLILKWGGELTPAGRIQAEELGRIFRCMYPGGQGRHLSEDDSEMLPNHGEYAGAQGLGLLRLHSTFRHDLKIYASDEGRVQMTAAAFAKGLLALEGELTPILVQMVKSANTNGLLDNDCDSSKYQNMVKTRLHELLQQDREFTKEDREQINPGNALSINAAMDFVKNPVKCCQHVHTLIQRLMEIVKIKKEDPKTKDAILYHGETWELMGRRWGKIEKDFCTKHKRFDISKIPDIYDCIKYDLQHNNHSLQFEHAEELYINAKYLADIVIPQEYGLTVQEKLTIGQGICTPLLKKIRADLQRNIEETGEETVNRLNPRYSHGVSSPGRHVRTRLYFTSESHVHSLLTVLRYGGLLDVVKDEQWRRAMEYVSMVSELNYMSQIVVMLYEDPTKDPSSEERFHVELHFSPGVNCCVQKNLPPGPGFRPHSRNESSQNLGETGSGQDTVSQCSTRIEEEDVELGTIEDETITSPLLRLEASSPLMEIDPAGSSENLDSPTTSRNIDMMDLDPSIMDEPYDSGFLQSSAPIPISARTVAGHEAARLGSQLAATQRQRREREAGGVIYEPRARSYDHQRQDKSEKSADKLQYQSLDAVNNEADPAKAELAVPQIEQPTVTATCFSKPITLSHSLSSPELPVPSLLDVGAARLLPSVPSEELPETDDYLDDITPRLLIVGAVKKYGRSHSEMLLPSIEISSGESTTVPSSIRDLGDGIANRSRSLSPRLQRCLCYNCNVSELILRSRELPAAEQLNFRTYFVRSLSHKFSNCSCYSLDLDPDDDDTLTWTRTIGWPCYHFVQRRRRPTRTLSWPQETTMTDSSRDGAIGCGPPGGDTLSRSLEHLPAPKRLAVSSKNHNECCKATTLSIDNSNTLVAYQQHPSSVSSSHLCAMRANIVNNQRCKRSCAKLATSAAAIHPHLVPKLQQQRSFSSPDTRPSIIQPDPTCTARRHRHSISGQMSYFKLLGYNVSKKLTASANSLFSTAVISGSSSAPNLKDMVPPHASAVAAIEGFGGVPPIRPLETLHNALSLRQLDGFLEMMTSVPLFRTPASSPPKIASPGGSIHDSSLGIQALGMGISREYRSSDPEAARYRKKLCHIRPYISPMVMQYKNPDGETSEIRNQLSPTSPISIGWSSGPQSFLSSEPSSPAPTSTGECSMSMSLVSNDGTQPFGSSHKYSTTPCVDLEFSEFCMALDQECREGRGSVSYTDYYSNEDGQIRRSAGNDAGLRNLRHAIYGSENASFDNADDDEDYTLTLKQADEQKKQDVKLIFEQKESTSEKKATGSFKKIGRFRVESMEISDNDVRIKDSSNSSERSSVSSDKGKPTESEKCPSSPPSRDSDNEVLSESEDLDNPFSTSPSMTNVTIFSKNRNLTRSRSISTPKAREPKIDEFDLCCSKPSQSTSQNSLSTLSDNLEMWKKTLDEASKPITKEEPVREKPILVLSKSLTEKHGYLATNPVANEKK